MRKPLERVSLQTGNRIAWIAVGLFVAFVAGWIAHAASKPIYCFFAA